jgi:hypothetical protein
MKKWGKANLKRPAVPLCMHHNGMSHPKIQIESSNIWQKLQKEPSAAFIYACGESGNICEETAAARITDFFSSITAFITYRILQMVKKLFLATNVKHNPMPRVN